MSSKIKGNPEAVRRAEKKNFDALPAKTKIMIAQLSRMSETSRLLNEGKFSGYMTETLIECQHFMKELHYNGLLEIEKDPEAMKLKGVRAAVEEGKRLWEESKAKAVASLVRRSGGEADKQDENPEKEETKLEVVKDQGDDSASQEIH